MCGDTVTKLWDTFCARHAPGRARTRLFTTPLQRKGQPERERTRGRSPRQVLRHGETAGRRGPPADATRQRAAETRSQALQGSAARGEAGPQARRHGAPGVEEVAPRQQRIGAGRDVSRESDRRRSDKAQSARSSRPAGAQEGQQALPQVGSGEGPAPWAGRAERPALQGVRRSARRAGRPCHPREPRSRLTVPVSRDRSCLSRHQCSVKVTRKR